jgi:hypothetical protein
MTLLSSLLLVAEPVCVGLVNYVAPNMFLNPKDGIFRFLSVVRTTSLDSNHFDPINRVLMMAIGACVLTIAVLQILAKDHMAKRSLLRNKLYYAAFMSLVGVYTLITMDESSSMLNPKLIGFHTGLHFSNLMWIASDMIHYCRHTTDDVARTPAKLSHIATLLVAAFEVLGWARIKILCPETLVRGHVLPFWNKTPSEDQVTPDELHVFLSRLEGVFLLTGGLSTLEALFFDRSIERIRWANTAMLITLGLYFPVFFRAALDARDGYVNRELFIALNTFHVLVGGIILRYGPNLSATKQKEGAVDKKRDKKKDIPGPKLVEEKLKKTH